MNFFDRDQFTQLLMFMYRVIVASAPLLEAAIAKSDGELKQYYEKHLDEERGHDELLLADLKMFGITDIPYYPLAAQLAGSQYYLIAHDDPAMLLGYMYALENNIWTPEFVDELEAHYKIELTCLRHHATHDTGHAKDLENMINQLDKDAFDKVALVISSSRALVELQIRLIGD